MAVKDVGAAIDRSHSWSEEDLREFTAASLRRLKAEETDS